MTDPAGASGGSLGWVGGGWNAEEIGDHCNYTNTTINGYNVTQPAEWQ